MGDSDQENDDPKAKPDAYYKDYESEDNASIASFAKQQTVENNFADAEAFIAIASKHSPKPTKCDRCELQIASRNALRCHLVECRKSKRSAPAEPSPNNAQNPKSIGTSEQVKHIFKSTATKTASEGYAFAGLRYAAAEIAFERKDN